MSVTNASTVAANGLKLSYALLRQYGVAPPPRRPRRTLPACPRTWLTDRAVYVQGRAGGRAAGRRQPVVDVNMRLDWAHLYIFKHWVLQLLVERKNLSSIQHDLVPLLVKSQHVVAAHRHNRPLAPSTPSVERGPILEDDANSGL